MAIGDDLTALPAVIGLSRQARSVFVAHLIIAVTFIAILVV